MLLHRGRRHQLDDSWRHELTRRIRLGVRGSDFLAQRTLQRCPQHIVDLVKMGTCIIAVNSF